MKKILPILLIILLAVILRVYRLDQDPPSLSGDEIDVGYQAYSLLKTGSDYSGQFLPVYIKSLSEFRAPLYIYSDIPFIAIFGLNEWGVRLSAAFWGVVSVLGIYLLTKLLFNAKVGLASALFLSVSPWSLQYSRAAFEVTMLLSFLVFGLYFFVLSFKNRLFLIPSAILFGLTPYIYSTAAVFTPLVLLMFVVVYRKNLWRMRKFAVVSLIILFFIALPDIYLLVRGESGQRFGLVSIFQDTVLLDKINLARKGEEYFTPGGKQKTVNPATEFFFYNKPAIFAQVFSLNYLRAFSFDFLFATGDPDLRQSVQEMGELYIFDLILLILGIYYLVKEAKPEHNFTILGWLLLAPIPAALTYDGGFHATRLILMLPPIMIIEGLGFYFLVKHIKLIYYRMVWGLLIVMFITSTVSYFHRYYVHYPIESWRFWQLGFKQAMGYMRQNQAGYDKLIFNDSYEPSLIRFAFWFGYPPDKLQSQIANAKPVQGKLPDFYGYSLDNRYYFGEVDPSAGGVLSFIKPDMLYMVSQRDEVAGNWDWEKSPPANIQVLDTVRDPTGVPIFYVVTGRRT